MSGHTPTPWVVDEDPFEDKGYKTLITLPNKLGFMGTVIARVEHNWNEAAHGERRISWKEAEATTAHIVHCANMHDELVAALEGVMDILGRAESNASGNPEFDYVGPRVAAARAALAKAKGGAA